MVKEYKRYPNNEIFKHVGFSRIFSVRKRRTKSREMSMNPSALGLVDNRDESPSNFNYPSRSGTPNLMNTLKIRKKRRKMKRNRVFPVNDTMIN
jgi:hypothetical protein